MDEEARESVIAYLRQNIAALKDWGVIRKTSPEPVLLDLPLKARQGFPDFGFYCISNFVDHNPAYPSHLMDYNCGYRTYDTSGGSNHAGTDFILWPDPWAMVENNDVEVVAAAPGVIVGKRDGNYDRQCQSGSSSQWNAVYVYHADGVTAWYGHMKNGSLTTKAVGETVERGEYLGVVASSGSSTWPHLHLELHDENFDVLDPFAGPCNPGDSLWVDQPPYWDPAVLKINISATPPQATPCPEPWSMHGAACFEPGRTLYFTLYYRDMILGLTATGALYAPDGSPFTTFSQTPDANYEAATWISSIWIPGAAPRGDWRLDVSYNGQSYQAPFSIQEIIPGDVNGDGAVSLADAIMGLQVMTCVRTGEINPGSLFQNAGNLGFPEILFVLQTVSGEK